MAGGPEDSGFAGGLRLVADFATGSCKNHRLCGVVVAKPRPWRRSGLGTRAHATGRWPRSTDAAPRVPSPARPPGPGMAAAPVVGGQQDNTRPSPAGEREPRRAAAIPSRRRQPLPHQVGAVGSGRAGCARRGGHLGEGADPRRVLARPALNGATAAAWPLRSPARDKLRGSPSPTGQPLRSKARCRTVPQSQQRAASRQKFLTRSRPA